MTYQVDSNGTKLAPLLLLSLGVIMVPVSTIRAADVEYRDFAATIDGKPAGALRLSISNRDDALTIVEAQANISVRIYLVRYTYSFRGSEWWQAGRLQRMQTDTNDNGKVYRVQAVAETQWLQVSTNGRPRLASLDSWTSLFWCLPPQRLRNGILPIVDADTGQPMQATLRYVGQEQVQAGGQVISCNHFRLPELQIDLWYDARERLVRKASIEDGHPTTLLLTAIH